MTDIEKHSFSSVSLVRQGEHTFYSLTIPSEVLAKTCIVVSRDEDPIEGFQRELDEKRARDIANYIDSGLGTIPSSIVLSAQDDAALTYDSKKKTIAFNNISKAFLIIDGQHRVYGFRLAKTAFRVPVVIYSGLSKRDETRLFIDINTLQKGVSPELLLDIKKMADYEKDSEEFMREIFDAFNSEPSSTLYGGLSPFSKSKGKITRTTFNAAFKPLLKIFSSMSQDEAFSILNSYLIAFNDAVLERHDSSEQLFNVTIFKAICGFFPTIAAKVKDRHGPIYNVDNFYSALEIVGQKIKPSKFRPTSSAYKAIVSSFEDCLKTEFTL